MKKIEVYEWEGNGMRGLYKKLTHEDKFARKYYCNSYRFLPNMKRRNRRKLRRILKDLMGDDFIQEWPERLR
jgi:hypothetical protein